MTPRVGYYVHHHGRGHLHRAREVCAALDHRATVLTSLDPALLEGTDLDVAHLPMDVRRSDDPGARRDPPLPSVLHHAPVGVRALRRRTARLAGWFEDADPAALVVDVSVEVTLLARLAGVAPVVVRQHGERRDDAHRAAYEAAALVLAPWPSSLEDASTPQELRDRTCYVGGFSRFDRRDRPDRAQARLRFGWDDEVPTVVVLHGTGDTDRAVADGRAGIAAAAIATPGWRWATLGGDRRRRRGEVPDNLEHLGWLDDVLPLLVAADVVVTHAGHNAVMELAAAGSRAVVVPRPRPFDEQRHKADALDRLGAAVVEPTWPAPARWPGVLARAVAHDPAPLQELVDGAGARRAAAAIDALVSDLLR